MHNLARKISVVLVALFHLPIRPTCHCRGHSHAASRWIMTLGQERNTSNWKLSTSLFSWISSRCILGIKSSAENQNEGKLTWGQAATGETVARRRGRRRICEVSGSVAALVPRQYLVLMRRLLWANLRHIWGRLLSLSSFSSLSVYLARLSSLTIWSAPSTRLFPPSPSPLSSLQPITFRVETLGFVSPPATDLLILGRLFPMRKVTIDHQLRSPKRWIWKFRTHTEKSSKKNHLINNQTLSIGLQLKNWDKLLQRLTHQPGDSLPKQLSGSCVGWSNCPFSCSRLLGNEASRLRAAKCQKKRFTQTPRTNQEM